MQILNLAQAWRGGHLRLVLFVEKLVSFVEKTVLCKILKDLKALRSNLGITICYCI